MHPVQPVVQERSSLTDIEILLQSMLPVGSVTEEDVQPPAHRQEPTAGCFLCGELDHATERCPVWMSRFLSCHRGGGRIKQTINLYYDRPRGGLPVSKRETSTDPGRGVGRPAQ